MTHKENAKLLRAYPLWARVQQEILSQLADGEWSGGNTSLRDIRKALRGMGEHED
jgi:hypothetical protein